METLLNACASWSSTLRLDAVPGDVRAIARTCLIDTVGVALAGASTDVGRETAAFAASTYGVGGAMLFASAKTLQAPGAAFANAVCAHALDFDDNCYAGVVHGSAVIVPAALAVCQAVGASGERLLTAIIAGAETEYAIGQAFTLSLYERGWFNSAFLGPLGASAAACRVLNLDPRATANALGLAMATAGGSKACFGTDGKALLVGRAAEWGVTAALLAAQGLTGPTDALEGRRGVAELTNGGLLERHAVEQIGKRWYLRDPGIDIKPAPVCLSSHAAIDAAQQIISEHTIEHSAIQSIICDVPELVRENLKYHDPQTPQEKQFSIQFAVACSIKFGCIRLDHLALSPDAETELQSLMRRVQMVTTDRWLDLSLRERAPEGAFVSIRTFDGSEHTHLACRSKGVAALPLSVSEIDAKFVACGLRSKSEGVVSGLLSCLRRIEQMPDLRSLPT